VYFHQFLAGKFLTVATMIHLIYLRTFSDQAVEVIVLSIPIRQGTSIAGPELFRTQFKSQVLLPPLAATPPFVGCLQVFFI
jgi:hypothetical protein